MYSVEDDVLTFMEEKLFLWYDHTRASERRKR